MKKLIVILLWSVISTTHSIAQIHVMDTASTICEVTASAKKGEWETVKESKGITIKYRGLRLNKSVKTRELSAHFTVESHIDSVLSYLQISEKHALWNKGIKFVKTLEQDSIHWVTHSMYNIPFPISQQDLVSQYVLVTTEGQHIIHVTSKPSFIPPIEDIDRVKHYIAQWTVTSLGNNKVDVMFSAITLSKSYIPRFIKDPIVQNNLLKSFKAFKHILSSK